MEAHLSENYSQSITVRVTLTFFAAALFTSAYLLFWLQPLIGKMLLPLLGGAPSVWNTCMVFFQGLLLAGYAYALFISQRLRLRNQALLHLALVLSAALFLPFAISGRTVDSLPAQNNPTLWLLGVLSITVGFPFFILSATAPLLQRWFSHSRHGSAKDPYFLYAVSNAGSMLSLLAFPFLLEPNLDLRKQSLYWAFGYVLLAVLIACCAALLKDRVSHHPHKEKLIDNPTRLTKRLRGEWILLAFIPSSLMLGVTTYISTDVASVPLIWIVPLSLYLLTFILAFANKQLMPLRLASLLLPAAIVVLALVVILRAPIDVWLLIALHLAVFFIAGFVCHRRIALGRPSVSKLPEYYLCISVGGVLGGVVNALLAPVVFSTPLEYPIVIVAAGLILPLTTRVQSSGSWLRVAFPAPILGFIFAISMLATVLIGGYRYIFAGEDVLTTQRNFFGVWRVSSEVNGAAFHKLKHGSTVHGWQFTAPDRQCLATSYFHKDGPLGQVFETQKAKHGKHVAVIGLGAGTVATYSASNEQWDYYDIDPAIVGIAQDRRYFTFLSQCAAAPYKVILGDARLRLREAPQDQYGLIILDAFSSDSVPAHLLTRQAMELYLSKLAANGLVAFHISNRYLNLEPLLSGLSQEKGLSGRIRKDQKFDAADGKYPSTWVVVARTDSDLGNIANDSRWQKLTGNIVWTDDFSNILSLME